MPSALPSRTPRLLALAALGSSLGAACGRGGDAGRAARPAAVVVATAADADQLIPPLVATTQGKQAVDLLFDNLAEPGDSVVTVGDAGFRPQLARRWTWAADSLSIAFELDPRARFHDGRPVRAGDVRFSFALYTDPAVASMHAHAFDGIDSVTVRDSLTAVVWWRRRTPEQFFQIAYNLAVMPEHLLGAVPRGALAASPFASHPVGSGRYRFAAWERRRQLTFAADTAHYRGRPRFDRVVWTVAGDPAAALASVLSGQADVIETLRGEAYDKARQSPRVRTVEYGSIDYAYMAFNLRPRGGAPSPFAERGVRVALTQAVDRAGVVANAMGPLGRVALGPFTRDQATADTALRQIAHDPAAAARALDALGWRAGPGGTRARGGRPLELSMLVPSTSATRMRLAVLLQEQLGRAGVKVNVDAVDAGAFVERLHAGDFDVVLNMWRVDPSPASLRETWGTARGADRGANVGDYSNAAFDALADSAKSEFRDDRRTAMLRRAYQLIVDDAPAVWLYEPRNVAAVRRDMRPAARALRRLVGPASATGPSRGDARPDGGGDAVGAPPRRAARGPGRAASARAAQAGDERVVAERPGVHEVAVQRRSATAAGGAQHARALAPSQSAAYWLCRSARVERVEESLGGRGRRRLRLERARRTPSASHSSRPGTTGPCGRR
jgi:peptide/nickel transport system substrate-binding protein